MSIESSIQRTPETASINAYNASVDIVSGIDLGSAYKRLIEVKAPIIYRYNNTSQENGFTLYHEDSDKNEIYVSSDRMEIEVRYPNSQLRSGEVLFTVAYPLIETQLQEQGYLTCHAACVEVEGNGVLLLGPNGSGKTSAVLELCKNYDSKLVGNNSCIIGLDNSVRTVEGTKPLTLRYSSIIQDHPELSSKFPLDAGDPWTKKISVSPEEIGIETRNTPINIDSAYLLHVDNTLTTLYRQRANSLDDRLYLYDNFSRIIRATGMTPLLGDSFDNFSYFPSLDKKEYFQKRASLIGYVQNNLFMERLTGPLKMITDYISQHAKEVSK